MANCKHSFFHGRILLFSGEKFTAKICYMVFTAILISLAQHGTTATIGRVCLNKELSVKIRIV